MAEIIWQEHYTVVHWMLLFYVNMVELIGWGQAQGNSDMYLLLKLDKTINKFNRDSTLLPC